VWYKATSVVNNNALLPIPTFGSSLDNNVSGSSKLASATITETKTVEITVPHGDQGVIMFGVPAVEVKGYLYTRDVLGHVTRTPMEAWAPLYPAVFGFNAYVTPLAGKGTQSEVPVIPLPAG
jgi:hypothetical protein